MTLLFALWHWLTLWYHYYNYIYLKNVILCSFTSPFLCSTRISYYIYYDCYFNYCRYLRTNRNTNIKKYIPISFFHSPLDSSRHRAPPVADTESIEGAFIKPGPLARVGSSLQCSARIELAPPGGGPHGERGATQEPHSTPAQDTAAVYRAPLLALPSRSPGLMPGAHLVCPVGP